MITGPSLANLRVLLGVSGGIAAYKACEFTRRLRDAGAQVRVVLTENAARFVTPLTFQALSGNPVRYGLWDEAAEAAMGHIELARWADRIVIAPASADIIARLATGMADDLLTTLCLATAAPIAIAPAMNQLMWAKPATQDNIAILRKRAIDVLGPASGGQACGEFGAGRLLEANELVDALARLHGARALNGTKILVSAGPTFEDIDPVRFIGNRSSGRMGFAIAQAAAEMGAEVQLIAGPVHLPTPPGVAREDVRSAREMREAVLRLAPACDVFVSAAAVGDYRLKTVADHKLKKTDGPLKLDLVENPDILAELGGAKSRPFLVGFAAETDDIAKYARSKLLAKNIDVIAANPVGDGKGFDASDNELTLYWKDGEMKLPRSDKLDLARALLAQIIELRTARTPSRMAKKKT